MSEADDEVVEEFNADDPVEPETDVDAPDPDDEEDGDEEEAEAAPEEAPEDPSSFEQMRIQDAYTKRARAYLAKNMGEVFGDAATEYVECPFCNYFSTPGWLHLEPCPAPLLGTVYEYANMHAPDEYLKDNYSSTCNECNGLGEVDSGSKVSGQAHLSCINCKGMGWTPNGPQRLGPGMITPNGLTQASPPPATDATGELSVNQADPPEVATLKERGYTVIAPFSFQA